jgi:hypothetical protein
VRCNVHAHVRAWFGAQPIKRSRFAWLRKGATDAKPTAILSGRVGHALVHCGIRARRNEWLLCWILINQIMCHLADVLLCGNTRVSECRGSDWHVRAELDGVRSRGMLRLSSSPRRWTERLRAEAERMPGLEVPVPKQMRSTTLQLRNPEHLG